MEQSKSFLKLINFLGLSCPISQLALIETEEITYVTGQDLWHIRLKITKPFDPQWFCKIFYALLNNKKLAVKIKIEIMKPQCAVDVMRSYVTGILDYNSDFKTSYLQKLEVANIHFIQHDLIWKVASNTIADLVKTDFGALLNCLKQLGFSEITGEIEISDKLIPKEIPTLNQNQNTEQIDEPPTTNPNSHISEFWKDVEKIKQQTVPFKNLVDLTTADLEVVVQGKIFIIKKIMTRKNFYIYTIGIYDGTNSFYIKCFDYLQSAFFNHLKSADCIKVVGKTSLDKYSNSLILNANGIMIIPDFTVWPVDSAPSKRVELNTHTKMSVMDGVSSPQDYFQLADKLGHNAVAFTDHINVQAFPEIYRTSQLYPDIKPIYGVTLEAFYDTVDYCINPQQQDLATTTYVFFDLETTGLNAVQDEIIQFGAVVSQGVYDHNPTKISFLIKPKQPLPAFVQKLSGLKESDFTNAPTIEEVFPKIMEIIADHVLVAHNADFDMEFLQVWAKRLKYNQLTNTVIDTLQLARALILQSKNYQLGTIARKLGVVYEEDQAHQADYDADVLCRVYQNLYAIMKNEHNVKTADNIPTIHGPHVYRKMRPSQVVALVKNAKGLKTLFKIISLSHTKFFYRSPQISWNYLNDMRKDLLIGSAGFNGEVFQYAMTKSDERLRQAMVKYDYIEVQPPEVYSHLLSRHNLTPEALHAIITRIIKVAQSLGKLVVATSDAHYALPQQHIIRDIYVKTKGLGGISHPLFNYQNPLQDSPAQHLRSTNEMLAAFNFLKDDRLVQTIVIDNSQKIAEQIENNIEVIKTKLHTPNIPHAAEKLKKICYAKAFKQYGENLPVIVKDRLQKEFLAINTHHYAVIYYMAYKLVQHSLKDGYLVGSRGSVGSSLVAALADITEVNPLPPHYYCPHCGISDFNVDAKYQSGFDLPPLKCSQCGDWFKQDGQNIPFETFLGFKGDKVPDIDLNFSGEYQSQAHEYIRELFGTDHVFRAGTISTVANKTAFGYVKIYLDMYQKLESTNKAEIERLALLCEGVKRTTGQHPGGIVIIPSTFDVEDFTPVNFPADDSSSNWLTTHLDFNAIHDNVLKLDILGHVDPTALRMLQELTSVNPQLIPTQDSKVMELFLSWKSLNISSYDVNNEPNAALGIPEFGTSFVRRLLSEAKPTNFAELVKISGLSHGKNVWMNNLQKVVSSGASSLSEIIACRDDIMVFLINQKLPPVDAFKIMEQVRKGEGLTPGDLKLLGQHNVPNWFVDACKSISYMFPKAHAVAYVLMAWRIAWFKFYYPAEYYATFFSTRTDVFDLATLIQGQNETLKQLQTLAKHQRVKFGPNKLTAKQQDLIVIYEIALEMFARGLQLLNIDLNKSHANKFTIINNSDGSKAILPPLSAIDSLGIAVANSIVQARAKKPFTTIEDLKNRTIVSKTHLKIFEQFHITDDLSAQQITLDF